MATGTNYTPKQALRLRPDTLVPEAHADKMVIALSLADARRIVGSGVWQSSSAASRDSTMKAIRTCSMPSIGWVCGLSSSRRKPALTFSDSALAPVQGGEKPDHFGGINEHGHKLVRQMNELGILIDIAHGTEAVQAQLIENSRAPVVASHETVKAVSGAGLSDEVLKALANKGGLIGIHGAAAVVGKRYRQWMASNPAGAANSGKAVFGMVGYQPSFTRPPGDHGEFIERMDREFRERWMALADWKEDPAALPSLPTADEWAEHVDYVIKLVGADHVAIGLDMVAGRSSVPADPTGYPGLIAALRRITTPENVRKIVGENWMRVLDTPRRS